MGRLQAMDVSGGKLAWTHDLDAPIPTSALATAGGVVFAGDLDPALKAFDDRDGKLLWSAPLENFPSSSVITYSVGGVQYVAVVVGMTNNHINDMSRRYQEFRKSRGLSLPPTATTAAIQVFAVKR
jgi:outer membrane protein assembly factor BamB